MRYNQINQKRERDESEEEADTVEGDFFTVPIMTLIE